MYLNRNSQWFRANHPHHQKTEVLQFGRLSMISYRNLIRQLKVDTCHTTNKTEVIQIGWRSTITYKSSIRPVKIDPSAGHYVTDASMFNIDVETGSDSIRKTHTFVPVFSSEHASVVLHLLYAAVCL